MQMIFKSRLSPLPQSTGCYHTTGVKGINISGSEALLMESQHNSTMYGARHVGENAFRKLILLLVLELNPGLLAC